MNQTKNIQDAYDFACRSIGLVHAAYGKTTGNIELQHHYLMDEKDEQAIVNHVEWFKNRKVKEVKHYKDTKDGICGLYYTLIKMES